VTWGAIHIFIYINIYICIQALLAFSPWSVVRTSAEQWIVDMPRGILSFLLNIYKCVNVHICTCTYIDVYMPICVGVYIHTRTYIYSTCIYGVATVSRIDKIIGLFCRI